MRSRSFTLCMAALLLAAPGLASAEFTGPGKTTAYASSNSPVGGLASGAPSPVAALSIVQGKSKRVLDIAATMFVQSGAAVGPVLTVEVNGFDVEPTAGAVTGIGELCSGSCTVSGNWWLDLDKAEIAHPGLYLGQELQVVLRAYDGLSGGGQNFTATLSAKMEKK